MTGAQRRQLSDSASSTSRTGPHAAGRRFLGVMDPLPRLFADATGTGALPKVGGFDPG
jgi:hypothetical protein